MKLLKDTDPRFQFLGWRVILFVLAIFLVLLGLAAGVALKQGMFVQKTRLHFTADHGAGLAPGLQVRFSGFRIGVVDKVALDEQAKVNVDIVLESRYMKWIKADTVAQMLQDGLMGDYYFEMMGGSPNLPPLQEGGRVQFAPLGQSIGDIAQDLKNRALPIIDSVQETMNYINNPNGDVRQIVTNVRVLTSELRDTRAKVDQLLARADSLANKEVRDALHGANQAIARGDAALQSANQLILRTDATLSEVQMRLPRIMDQAASSVAHLEVVTRDAASMTATLKSAVHEAAPQLPGLVRHTNALVKDSSDTLQGLQQSWPLNKMLTPVPLDVPVPDSRQ